MDLQQICNYYGYPFEEHAITTSDGYILSLMRVPSGRENSDISNRPPILLIHSFLDAAVFWAIRGPDFSPAFYLADAGYDVWLINVRGTSRSLRHESLDWETDEAYWDVSWLEMSHDNDAAIQYIQQETNYETIAVAVANLYNHQFFTGMSNNPQFYHDSVSIVLALDPIFHMEYNTLPNYQYMCQNPGVITAMRENGMWHLGAPRSSIFGMFNSFMQGGIVSTFPMFVEYSITALNPGEGPNVYDEGTILNIFSHSEQSVPLTYLEQAFQNCNAERYQHYDYGAQQNMEVYGTETPPLISLENIDTPVALFSAPEDALGSYENTDFIITSLGDNIVFEQSYEGYSRDSFIAGIDMRYLEDVVDLLESFPPTQAAAA